MPHAHSVAQHVWCCAHVLGHAALQYAALWIPIAAEERAGPALGLCLQPRTAQVAPMPRSESRSVPVPKPGVRAP